jgi:hypothetical protein
MRTLLFRQPTKSASFAFAMEWGLYENLRVLKSMPAVVSKILKLLSTGEHVTTIVSDMLSIPVIREPSV